MEQEAIQIENMLTQIREGHMSDDILVREGIHYIRKTKLRLKCGIHIN